MEWITEGIELVLGFFLGTLVLWFCSKATSSPNANFKTALIYNAIMTGVGIILIGVAIAVLAAGWGVGLFFAFLILTIIVSFILLMWLYEISFLPALGLVIAMIAVGALVDRIAEAVS